MRQLTSFAIALWGISSGVGLLSFAIVRLLTPVREAWGYEFSWIHWTVLGVNIVFMAYSEGYRGFHRSFAPRFVARVVELCKSRRPLGVVLAPFFCAGYFGVEWKRQRIVYGLTAGIILLVTLVRELPQPWRGIIDAGVVVGLSLGILSIAVHSAAVIVHGQPNGSQEKPRSE